jgi:probable H4MPT-linked C1 transfer pathway protein
MKVLGLDIGGANLKHIVVEFAADDSETVLEAGESPLQFWTDHGQLASKLTKLRLDSARFGSLDGVAVTMTAELADCFENKRQGVGYIVDQVEEAFPNLRCRFYNTHGQLVDSRSAKKNWSTTAASNWHASAWYLFFRNRLTSGFLVDIGSTTTDVIAVENGVPVSSGATDIDRLTSGELLYAGTGRTPVCSLISHVDLDQSLNVAAKRRVSIARELFATIADAIIWLGKNQDEAENFKFTADGRGQSQEACRTRLCRMLCADDEALSDDEVDQIANHSLINLKELIVDKIKRVCAANPRIPKTFCIAGGGHWLAAKAIADAFPVYEPTIKTSVLNESYNLNQTIPARSVAAKYFFLNRQKHCNE